MLRKTEGRRRLGRQGIRCLDAITDTMDMNLSKFQEIVKDRVAVHGVTNVRYDIVTETRRTRCGYEV